MGECEGGYEGVDGRCEGVSGWEKVWVGGYEGMGEWGCM